MSSHPERIDILFVGDYFVLRTSADYVEGMDDDQVIAKANEFLKQHYGWDVAAASIGIEVDPDNEGSF
jgi:hypothetical protein